VQTHNFKDAEGIVGFAPSCYLEPLDENAPVACLDSSGQDSSDMVFSAQQAEKKRKYEIDLILGRLFVTEPSSNSFEHFFPSAETL
jgi:hypothetical protein